MTLVLNFPENVYLSKACYATREYLSGANFDGDFGIYTLSYSGYRGRSRTNYFYRELVDGSWTNYESVGYTSTHFEMGKTYELRGDLYIDGELDDTYTKQFTVTKHNYTASVSQFSTSTGSGECYITTELDPTPKKSVSVPCGTKIYFHANPDPCSKLANWEVFEDGEWTEELEYPSPYEVELDQNLNLQAYFITSNVYTIKAEPDDPSHGEVRMRNESFLEVVPGDQTSDCGEKITFTAVPNDCYVFNSWNDGVIDATRTIEVKADINLVALFKEKPTEQIDVECHDLNVLSEANEVNIPLSQIVTGDLEECGFSSGLSLSADGKNVVGSLQFGDNTVDVYGVMCGKQDLRCSSKITLVRKAPTCEEND